MKAQEQKKPDLKTRMPGLFVSSCHWPTCLFIEQCEPIHLAA
jgi:hypothetical protein